MVQNGRIKNFVQSLGPQGLNQIEVGNDCRHVLRSFNEMSHEITYTGPLSPKISNFTKNWPLPPTGKPVEDANSVTTRSLSNLTENGVSVFTICLTLVKDYKYIGPKK